MNVEDKLRIAVKNFEEAERLMDRAKLQAQEAEKELDACRTRLVKAMNATGDLQVRFDKRTYLLRDSSSAKNDTLTYTEFNGRILE